MNNQEEIWKPIEGFNGDYEINPIGVVRKLEKRSIINGTTFNRKARIIQPRTSVDGYHSVTLFKNDKAVGKRISRLVAETFIPNPNNLPSVNHIDGVKSNNSIGNLEWVTVKENTIHAFKHNLRNNKAENNPHAKLKDDDIQKIFDSHKQGISNILIAEIYGVTPSTISGILCRKFWKTVNITL